MTINKEQPVSDAMLSAGRGAWQDYKGFSEDRVLTEIYLAMKAASHPLEQQQAVSGDVVERACVAFIEQIEAEMRALPEMFGKMPEDRQGFYCERVTDEQRDAVRRSMAAALTASGVERMREGQDRRNDLLRRLTSDVGGCFTYAEDAVREAIGNTNYSVIMQWVEEARTALQGGEHLSPQQKEGEA